MKEQLNFMQNLESKSIITKLARLELRTLSDINSVCPEIGYLFIYVFCEIKKWLHQTLVCGFHRKSNSISRVLLILRVNIPTNFEISNPQNREYVLEIKAH